LQSRFADGIHGGHIEERAGLVVSKIDDAVGAFLVRWAALLIDRVVAFGFSVCDKEACIGRQVGHGEVLQGLYNYNVQVNVIINVNVRVAI
jgi:hypothetical protein